MKKRKIKIINFLISIAMIFTSIFAGTFTASATDEIKVNGQAVNAGDIVTYSVYLTSSSKIIAINASVVYDNSVFSLLSGGSDNNAIVFGNVFNDNVMYNEVREDFLFNAASAVNGYDFSQKQLVVSLSFEVLKTDKASSDITFNVKELLDNSDKGLTEGKDYTLEYKLDINTYTGQKIAVNKNQPSINNRDSSATTSLNGNTSNTENSGSDNVTSVAIIIIIVIITLGVVIIVFGNKNKDSKKSDN